MAADIYAVVAGLGLRRPALVGLSMGGTIALQYALDHPADLSRLVVVDSLAGVPEEVASVRDERLEYIEAIPDATVHIIEGQGHFPNLEAPELFNPLLADALQIPKDLVPAR